MTQEELLAQMSGGTPIPPSFDVGSGGSNTFKTDGGIPQPPLMPPTPAAPQAAAPTPTPVAAPVRAIPEIPPQAAAPAAPVQGGIGAMLGEAQQAGQQMSGAYSPDKRAQLYAYLAQQQNSMPHAIGNTLASVGDAITKGYGRSQSNFLNDTQKNEQESRKEAVGTFDEGAKMNQEQTKQGMGLEEMDPSSAISKMAQQAFGSVLAKMGYSKGAISHMASSNISAIADVANKHAEISVQKDLKEATLELQAMQARGMMVNQQSERQQADEKLRAEHPIQAMLGKLGGTTQPAPATKTINGQTFVNHNGQWYHQ